MTSNCTAKELEHYETPKWAVQAILKTELLSWNVFDPCVGYGVIADTVKKWYGNQVTVQTCDIHNWWGRPLDYHCDFLDIKTRPFGGDFTVVMNPPFSKSVDFVKKCIDEWDVYKIVCFQRFAWWESATRRDFWDKYPPNRVYICGNRATCWRADIPKEERKSGSTTPHAWFVWERGHPKGTTLGHIWKD